MTKTMTKTEIALRRKQLIAKLKTRALDKRLTQQQIADMVGDRSNRVNVVLNNSNGSSISLDTFIAYADAVGCDVVLKVKKNKGKTQTALDWFYEKIISHFEHDGDLLETITFTMAIAKGKERNQF